MSGLPVCLVIGVGVKDSSVIMKGLLGLGDLPAASDNRETAITSHTWQINNKYYSASVQINGTSSSLCIDENLANRTEASILYFDSQKKNGLSDIEATWLPVLENCDNLDIKILVCDTCPEEDQSGVAKLEAQKWCIKHGFELVELEPSEIPDPDDDFPETLGMQRIIQALNAHSWPNMEMKDQGDRKKHDTFSETVLKKALDDQQPEDALFKFGTSGNSDNPAADGIDSFEELFQAMSMMKSQASALQGAERKAYAEKITMAFWRAIDGDVDEIAGLDSSGDEE